MSLWKIRGNKDKNNKMTEKPPHQRLQEQEQKVINRKLETTITFIKDLLGDNEDLVIRKFTIFEKHSAALFYISNLVDENVINTDILKPLITSENQIDMENLNETDIPGILVDKVIYQGSAMLEMNLSKLVEGILTGEAIIVIDGMIHAIHINTRFVQMRDVTQPETERVIIGPREGFIERLDTNISLLRYRLPTADFTVKTMKIGQITKSKVAICYLKGIANPSLIEEVEKRLSNIDIDLIMDVGYLEQFIEDNSFSPFPQTALSERPDSTVGNLMEGRVAVLVDGSPYSLVVPVVFSQFYQTTEDYSIRFLLGSFTRLIRILALVFSLIVPALYVSFISFNPELVPTEFAIAVAGGRAGVPYPAVVEVLILEAAMEVLREATVRLPNQIGGALSIVGVLIIGDAAVQAGISSPVTIVVIAVTTIGSFATPKYNASFALRIMRFPLIILAGIFGLYGVMVGIIIIFNHMLSLTSFGTPYMSPVSPPNSQGNKDVVVRFPFQWMPRRPAFIHPHNNVRVGDNADLVKTDSIHKGNQDNDDKN